MRFIKNLFILFLLITTFLISTKTTFASEYFDREYAITYTVRENGITNVSMIVTLKNKTTDYFATSDTITLGFKNIENVTAKDGSGNLTPNVTKTDVGNRVDVNFNQKAVGKDNSMIFNLSFDTKDIAHKVGNSYEINIPGISNPEEFSHFNTEVVVPKSFGNPTYIKPKQQSEKLVFSKEQLGTSGISIGYSNEQYYTFDLTYHLKNKNLFPIRTQIALPPTTNYQVVSVENIDPKPENVVMDEDGNWLAEYVLTPSQIIDVKATGFIKVLLNPNGTSSLTPEQIKKYTKQDVYWEVQNPQIQELAQKLKTPEKIYGYVVNTLIYDFSRVADKKPRLGALKVLSDQDSAVCLEFTDLFIALARAAGIPAREINGYAYTQNQTQRPLSTAQDILHSWPEYYDFNKQQWIMVDPTWGSTTGGVDYFNIFDLDHIVFVTKGINSKYPVPAGGYKFAEDINKKDVEIGFADSFSPTGFRLSATSMFSDKYLAGFKINGKILIENNGSLISPNKAVVLTSNTLLPNEQLVQLKQLPPYSSVEIPVSFKPTSLLTNSQHKFTIELDGRTFEQNLKINSFAFNMPILIGGILIVISATGLFIIIRKTRRIHVSR